MKQEAERASERWGWRSKARVTDAVETGNGRTKGQGNEQATGRGVSEGASEQDGGMYGAEKGVYEGEGKYGAGTRARRPANQ